MLATLFVLGPGAADAGVAVKTGNYNGKTDQDAVSTAFRKIQFTVKKGKVILITEPTVARGDCVSTPVFTLGSQYDFQRAALFVQASTMATRNRFLINGNANTYLIEAGLRYNVVDAIEKLH